MKASFPYDSSYDPAAPVLSIGLGPSGEESERLQLIAVVDTGADVTMIPTRLLANAGCRYSEQARLRGVVGRPVTVNLHLAAVHVAGQVIHGVSVIARKGSNEAILGRDVLNQLDLRLIGPAQELWIE
jgi:predicted aspartyl protease